MLPTDELKRIAFERLTLPSRALAAVIQLHQVATQLDAVLSRRNEFIERTKARAAAGQDPVTPYDYFGMADPSGHINMDFPDTLKAIFTQTDDVIFYSWLIGNDLADHGEAVSTRFRRTYGVKDMPKVRRADYSKPTADALMPAEDDYKMWLDAFPQVTANSLREKMRAALKKWPI